MMEPFLSTNGFPQRLRQMMPIRSLAELQAAAADAARLVAAGEVDRAQAADGLYDMAMGAGLVRQHGDDAVQAWISAAFSMIEGCPAGQTPGPPATTSWTRALSLSPQLFRMSARSLLIGF
jgi:hypothetical protein